MDYFVNYMNNNKDILDNLLIHYKCFNNNFNNLKQIIKD